LSPSSSGYGLSAPGRADFTSTGLDAGVEASGPHDFAVRCNVSRPLAVDRSQIFRLALQSRRAQNAAASTAFHPAFRDDHDTPLLWGGMARINRDDLPDGESEIFLQRGLAPTGKSVGCGHIPLVSRTRCSALPALLRRAGIQSRPSRTMDPGSAAHHAARHHAASAARCAAFGERVERFQPFSPTRPYPSPAL
jgi:hypothetical protein